METTLNLESKEKELEQKDVAMRRKGFKKTGFMYVYTKPEE